METKLYRDLQVARKNKATVKMKVVTSIITAIQIEKAKDGRSSLADAEILMIIQRLIKQRRESAKIFDENDRHDLADEELAQVWCLEPYLPAQLTDIELTKAVADTICKVGASSLKDMGKVMGILSKELAGKADGKRISDQVKLLLT